MGKDMGFATERSAGLEVRIQADKTALVRGLFRKYAAEPKNGTRENKRQFQGWSDIDSFDAVERCVNANKAVAKVTEKIARCSKGRLGKSLEETLTCPECKITFFSATHLKYHQQFVSCDKSPEITGAIADFESSDPETGMLFCPWCPSLLQGPLVIIHHMKKCREKRNHRVVLRSEVSDDFSCSDCQQHFSRENDLWRHVYVTHGRPYKCNRCAEEFTSKSKFKTHIVICTGEGDPRCSDCHENFSRRRGLLRHVTLNPHCKLVEPYVCKKCQISLFNRKLMLTHIWKHVRITRRKPVRMPAGPSKRVEIPADPRKLLQEPFDPFKIPDFFKPRASSKPPDPFKSPGSVKGTDFAVFKSPESSRLSEQEEILDGFETSDLFEHTDPLEPYRGFDDDPGQDSDVEGTKKPGSVVKTPCPIIDLRERKMRIGLILDHPYCLPPTRLPKQKRMKKPSPGKTSDSGQKKVEMKEEGKNKKNDSLPKVNADSTSKKKPSSRAKTGTTPENSKKTTPVTKAKTKPKKELIEAVELTGHADRSAFLQEESSPWDLGGMPLIQSVTSINDWNALPDASELAPSSLKKRRKKKKVTVDENLLSYLKESGEDPSAYEFVFFSDSDERESDVENEHVGEDPIGVESAVVDEPLVDELIVVDEPIALEAPIVIEEPPVPDAELLPAPEEPEKDVHADVLPTYGDIPIIMPFGNLTDVCLINPWDAGLVENPVRIENLTHNKKRMLQAQTTPSLVFDRRKPPEINAAPLVFDPRKPPEINAPPLVFDSRKPPEINAPPLVFDPREQPEVNAPLFLFDPNEPSETNPPSLIFDPRQPSGISNASSLIFEPRKPSEINASSLIFDPRQPSEIPNTPSLVFDPRNPLSDASISVYSTNTGDLTLKNKLIPGRSNVIAGITPAYIKLKGSVNTDHWIPFMSLSAKDIPPLRSLNDTVVMNGEAPPRGLAVAAEKFSREEDEVTISRIPQAEISEKGSETLSHLSNFAQMLPPLPPIDPEMTISQILLPVPKNKGITYIFNKGSQGSNQMILQVPGHPPVSAVPHIFGKDTPKVAANIVKSVEPLQAEPPSSNEVQSLVIPIVLKKKNRAADGESSQKSLLFDAISGLTGAAKPAEKPLPTSQEKPLDPFDLFCREKLPEDNDVKNTNLRNVAVIRDKEDENVSDNEVDPPSPSYSFVDDGDDYSPVNAHSDSFLNDSSLEPPCSSEKTVLPEVKVMLTRVDDNKKESLEVIQRTPLSCGDCGRSFKRASRLHYHRSTGPVGCKSGLTSYIARHGGLPKPISPKKNSAEQREKIQAELSELTSSLNEILPGKDPFPNRDSLTCECCNRTFNLSVALNVHRSRMLTKKLTGKDDVPEVTKSMADDILSLDLQSPGSDTEVEGLDKLLMILDEDLEASSKKPDDVKKSQESDTIAEAEEVSTVKTNVETAQNVKAFKDGTAVEKKPRRKRRWRKKPQGAVDDPKSDGKADLLPVSDLGLKESVPAKCNESIVDTVGNNVYPTTQVKPRRKRRWRKRPPDAVDEPKSTEKVDRPPVSATDKADQPPVSDPGSKEDIPASNENTVDTVANNVDPATQKKPRRKRRWWKRPPDAVDEPGYRKERHRASVSDPVVKEDIPASDNDIIINVGQIIETACASLSKVMTDKMEESFTISSATAGREETSLPASTSTAEKEEISLPMSTSTAEKEEISLPTSASTAEKGDTSLSTSTSAAKKKETSLSTSMSEAEKEETSLTTSTSTAGKEEISLPTSASTAEKEETSLSTSTSVAKKGATSLSTSMSEAEKEETSPTTSTSTAGKEEISLPTSASTAVKEETSLSTSTSAAKKKETSLSASMSEAEKEETSLSASMSEAEKEETSLTTSTSTAGKEEISLPTSASTAEREETSLFTSTSASEMEGTIISTSTPAIEKEGTSLFAPTSEAEKEGTSFFTFTSSDEKDETSLPTSTSTAGKEESSLPTSASTAEKEKTSLSASASAAEMEGTGFSTSTSIAEMEGTSFSTFTSAAERTGSSLSTSISAAEKEETSLSTPSSTVKNEGSSLPTPSSTVESGESNFLSATSTAEKEGTNLATPSSTAETEETIMATPSLTAGKVEVNYRTPSTPTENVELSKPTGSPGSSDPVYVCSYCYRKFSHQTSLKIHLTWEKKREIQKQALLKETVKLDLRATDKPALTVRKSKTDTEESPQPTRHRSPRKSFHEASQKILATAKKRQRVHTKTNAEVSEETKESGPVASAPETGDSKVATAKPETEEQFFNEISQKILMAVETEMKARSPQKSGTDEEVKQPERAQFSPADTISETGAPPFHPEKPAVSESAVKTELSKFDTKQEAIPRKEDSMADFVCSIRKTESGKMSRWGRRIKKKKRFVEEDDFGFLPKAFRFFSTEPQPVKVTEDDGEDAAVQEDVKEEGETAPSEQSTDMAPKPYQCSSCLAWFSSRQSLGGHRRFSCQEETMEKVFGAKQNKRRNRCPICKIWLKTINTAIVHKKFGPKMCRMYLNKKKMPDATVSEVPNPEESAEASDLPQLSPSLLGRPKFSCKVCGREFRTPQALRTHKWQRLRPGSFKTFCVPIGMKNLRDGKKGQDSETSSVVARPPRGKFVRKQRRRVQPEEVIPLEADSSSTTLNKESAPEEVAVSLSAVDKENRTENVPSEQPTSAKEPKVLLKSKCKTCGRTFESAQARKVHVLQSESSPNVCVKKQVVTKSFNTKTSLKGKAVSEGSASLTCDGCGRTFISPRSLKLHQFHAVNAKSGSLTSTVEACAKVAGWTRSAELNDTKNRTCVQCGRPFPSFKSLWTHKFFIFFLGKTSCLTGKTEAEKSAKTAVLSAKGEASVEESFESAKDESSAETSFESAKGDAELPAESAREEVRVEAPTEELTSATKVNPSASQPSAVSVCKFCHRSFRGVRSLRMHINHRNRKGFCNLDTSTTHHADDTLTSDSVLLENDDTNDSTVAPSLPLDETSVDFDSKADDSSSQKNTVIREDTSESSTLHTSDSNPRMESLRGRSSKGKKMMVLKSLYQCELCSTSYTYLKSLFRHVETTHGNAELKCNDCGLSFNSAQGLQIHIMTKETLLFKTAFKPVKSNEVEQVSNECKSEEKLAPEENDSSAPAVEAPQFGEASQTVEPAKSGKRRKRKSVVSEQGSSTPTVEAEAKVAKRSKKTLTENAAGGEGCLASTIEAARIGEALQTVETSQTVESPSKPGRRMKKSRPKTLSKEDGSLNPAVEPSTRPEKLKGKPKDTTEDKSSTPSIESPAKRKLDPEESLHDISDRSERSPVRRGRSAKVLKLGVDSDTSESSTPSRVLRSNAIPSPVDSSKEAVAAPVDTGRTRTVTFILSFEKKNVRFVSLKCYPQQPPNPIVHCSKCKKCMKKEQIEHHDCDSNHFICMCPKCRLHFPYDQYTLMDANRKRRLCPEPSNPEPEAKTVSSPSETNTIPMCSTNRDILTESNKIKKCALCGEVQDSFSKLEKHLKLVHTKLLTCLKCGTCFSETNAWENHVQLNACASRDAFSNQDLQDECTAKKDVAGSGYCCDSCNKLFDNAEKLDEHSCSDASSSSFWKLFRCNSCSRWFQNEQLLQTHKDDNCDKS